jgi:endonuclease III
MLGWFSLLRELSRNLLLLSSRKPILPVDVHVHRTSIHTGFIGEKVSADAAHGLLQALLPQDARVIYNFHKGLLRHDQRICVYERPRCRKCPITDLCDWDSARIRTKMGQLLTAFLARNWR